VTAEDWTRNWL